MGPGECGGPAGIRPANPDEPDMRVPAAEIGTLLARIGAGPWIVVGSDRKFTADRYGKLRLAFNDRECCYDDNSGSVKATVTATALSLGAHTFGSTAKVKLTDKTGERASSRRRIVFDVVKFVPVDFVPAAKTKIVEPAVRSKSKPPTSTEVKLRLHPKAVTAVPGARKLVSAWTCPADDRSPFGPDREPGTRDDACTAAEAEWRLRDEATARLNRRTGHKVLVQLAEEADNRVIATLGELKQGTPISWKPRPDGKSMPPIMGDGPTEETTPPEPDEPESVVLKLRLQPRAISAVPGARKLVSAWTCPADDKSPFGPDREPGTADDDCTAVEANWRLQDEATARLNKRTGHKVLVQLAEEADNRVIATYGELKQGTPISWQPRPADKPMPELMPPFVAEEPAASAEEE